MLRSRRTLITLSTALTAAFCGSAALAVPSALATSRQETIFQDDVLVKRDPTAAMAALAKLGVDRVRVFVNWRDVAPASGSSRKPKRFDASNPASYPAARWGLYDAIDLAAQVSGVKLYFDVTGPAPRWAASGGPAQTDGLWKPSAHEFGSFVAALGKRYSGSYATGYTSPLPRVSFWGVWNEPNYGVDLAPQTVHGPLVEVAPAVYRGLIDAAWAGLHASGHGSDTFLIGELAPRGQTSGGQPGTFGGMVPIRFLRALYCVDGRQRPLRGRTAAERGCPTNAAGSARFYRDHPGLFDATGFADHPYPQGNAPLVPTWPYRSENLYADWSQLPTFERRLDQLQRVYGRHKRYPIYNTEFGDQVPRVSDRTAAVYLNWFEYLSWRDSRLVTYDQYLLRDTKAGNFPTGLETASGRKLATYDAFRLPLFLPNGYPRRGASTEVWGGVRPAKGITGPKPAKLEFQANSRGAFTTIATVGGLSRAGYFDIRVRFPSSGSVRLTWVDPAGATLHSRTASVTVR